jgi:NAD+ synthase (glutamine-hydrolysing)
MLLALAQINPKSGDIDGNTAKILDALERARAGGADVLVAPEMAVPGYCVFDLLEDVSFLDATRRAVDRIARETRGIAAVVGFVEHDPLARGEAGSPRRYNSAAVFDNGSLVGIARKSLLPSYRYFDDKRFFTPADRRDPISVRGMRLGVSVCEDLWDGYYPIKPIPELVAKGADIILNINASPFYPGKRAERDALIRGHIRATRRSLVYVNTVGAGDNGKNIIPFDGESLAYDAEGRLIAVGAQFAEDLVFADLAAPPVALPPLDREREMFEALVMALGDYVRKTGFTRAIVPVSGGIDSALALAVAVEALGPDRVAAYNLPSRFNSGATRSLAERIARAFGVAYHVVPIDAIDEMVRTVFERHAHPMACSVTAENLQARVRGILMMAESNDTGALLISCGNETEIALGYATLYGDMCGGISVIGDVSKVDVYRLARYVNRRHGEDRIPPETFTIAPSAELAAGQRDPFDYSVVAPVVSEIVEKRRNATELVSLFERRALDPDRFTADPDGRTVYDKHTPATFGELVERIARMVRRSVYKRLQGPPIIAISERAFGFDLRETIINGWNE